MMTSGLAKGRNASRQSSSATARASFSVTVPSKLQRGHSMLLISFFRHLSCEIGIPQAQLTKEKGATASSLPTETW